MTDRPRQRCEFLNREFLIREFLQRHGWGAAVRQPLADDASFRRYERLTLDGKKAVLMDAPPEFEDVRPFIAVARYLQKQGLSPPDVMASDCGQGFLLLEDMGDNLFARILSHDPAQEKKFYQLAIDGLIRLHKSAPPVALDTETAGDGTIHNLPLYDATLLLQELALFVDWYMAALKGRPVCEQEREEFLALWQDVLLPVTTDMNYLVLRDYHAENLMLRFGKEDLAQLGLLDFQDAVIGHQAYDLVSLLQDARRDVLPALEQDMFSRYARVMERGHQDFSRDYAILGAQRAAKIIGIFTRLYLRDGKAAYLDKIPMVWRLLDRNLRHPILAPILAWLDAHISPELRGKKFLPKSFMPEKAMILAAGLGTRMRPLSDHCPKPLITVAGKSLLSYSLDGLCAAGVRQVVINMHYLADQMVDFVENHYDHRLSLTLSDERDQLMDSGGGVKKALKYLGDAPFLILNSDMVWRDGKAQMLHRMQAFWHSQDMDILMLLVARDQAVGYDAAGDYHRDDQGRLTARGTSEKADYVYGGIMMIRPDCFKGSPDGPFSLRQLFDQAEKNRRLFGIIHDGAWYHVGTPDMRDTVEDMINKCQGG